jgi:hypothetical protein
MFDLLEVCDLASKQLTREFHLKVGTVGRPSENILDVLEQPSSFCQSAKSASEAVVIL